MADDAIKNLNRLAIESSRSADVVQHPAAREVITHPLKS